MPNLRDHIRFSNAARLTLAQHPSRAPDPSPFPAREAISGALHSLRQATPPGPGRSEQTLYSACQHRARALQRILEAPSIGFADNTARFEAARHSQHRGSLPR
jgi:hypothetical protein